MIKYEVAKNEKYFFEKEDKKTDYYIGVDAGGTKTSTVAYDHKENVLNKVNKGSGNVSVNSSNALNNIFISIDDIINLENKFNLKGIALGIAGLPDGRKEELTTMFYKRYSVPIIIKTDYMMAFHSTFKGKDGILVIAGTGVVMFGSYRTKTLKIGGWGHLLGDEGSAYDIVIRTVKQAIALYEAKEFRTEIINELIDAIGSNNLDDLKRYVYVNEKSEIAQFAPLIVEKAKKGNFHALIIIEDIVDILYNKVELLVQRLNIDKKIPFSTIGGVLSSDSFVLELLLRKIKADSKYLQYIPSVDPTLASVYLINTFNN